MSDDSLGAGSNRNALLEITRAINALVQLNTDILASLTAINTTLTAVFPNSGGTAVTATAGAVASPGDYEGYIVVTLPDGTVVHVPYYLP